MYTDVHRCTQMYTDVHIHRHTQTDRYIDVMHRDTWPPQPPHSHGPRHGQQLQCLGADAIRGGLRGAPDDVARAPGQGLGGAERRVHGREAEVLRRHGPVHHLRATHDHGGGDATDGAVQQGLVPFGEGRGILGERGRSCSRQIRVSGLAVLSVGWDQVSTTG
jgi:hypothetical protein